MGAGSEERGRYSGGSCCQRGVGSSRSTWPSSSRTAYLQRFSGQRTDADFDPAIVADFGPSMTRLSCPARPGPRQLRRRGARDPYLTRVGAAWVVPGRQTGTTLALEPPNVGPGRSIPESFSGYGAEVVGCGRRIVWVSFHSLRSATHHLDFASVVLASLPWHSFFLASFHFLFGSFISLAR